MFKLFSRHCNDADVQLAKKEIDIFIKLCNDPSMGYSKKIRKFNTHSIVHLAEDREKFGPLSRYNAYGYEGILQILNKQFLSENLRVESLIKKLFLKMRLAPEETSERIISPKATIRVQDWIKNMFLQELRLEENQIKFLDHIQVDLKKLTTRDYSRRSNNIDSFVKCKNGKFYQACSKSFIYIFTKYYLYI